MKNYYDDYDDDWDYDCGDLDEHKSKDRIKWILTAVAFALVAVLLVGICLQVFGSGKQKPSEWFSDKKQTEKAVQLSAARASNTASPDTYLLTATIRPADVENPAVDWTIAWKKGAPKESEPVTDYVTVTPSSDGALTATVKCVKPFYGSTAIVTVTTREGGFTASSVVNFDGAPTELTVKSGQTAAQKITETGTYAVNMNNSFGYVGDKYRNSVRIESVTIGGTYTACNYVEYLSYGGEEETDIESNHSIAELVDPGGKNFTECVEVTLDDGGNVAVRFTASLTDMCREVEEHGDYIVHYGAFYANLNAYADITVKCNSLTATFRVNLTVGVYGVSLDMPEIAF